MNDEEDEQTAADEHMGKTLREKAKQKARRSPKQMARLSAEEAETLIHELQVHQIELEMQNDELQRAQAELAHSQQQYFDLYGLAPVGYLTLDEAGLIVEANLTLCDMLGVSRQAVLKRPLSRFIHPEEQDCFYLFRKKASSSKEKSSCEVRLHKNDDSWFWAYLQATPSFDDEKITLRMVLFDITEQKAQQLRSAKQAQIIEQIHDSVVSTDLEGIITSWNLGSERLSGYRADEVLGRHISMLYREEDRPLLKKSIEVLMRTGKYHADTYYVTKSKELIYTSLSLSLFKDEHAIPIGIIRYAQDITKRKKAENALEDQKQILQHQAYHDALTGLPNRLLFNDRLTQSIEKSQRHGTKVALFFIDLDNFKEINDLLGHDVGDEVLMVVAQRLNGLKRSEDTIARLGGDEFIIIIDDLAVGEDASILALKTIETLTLPMIIGNHELYVSSSIGISLYPDDGNSANDLLKFADAAMYEAKTEGKNNFHFYSPEMTKLTLERVVMAASLRKALEHEDFVVYYQPQVDGETDRLIGMEALVRWQHTSMGIVSPSKFISLAESTGLIVDIDRYVMRTAMTQLARWYEDGFDPGVLAMNLAMRQLHQKEFVDIFQDLLKESGCKPEWITLELTESQIMRDPEASIKVLDHIAELGIGLAVDDFGTGYSSLSYLKKLPIDKLKIDRSFVHDLPDDEDDAAIIEAVIALARSLKLDIIAEGVETKAQKKFLVENGCKNIQGYFYARPMPADKMEAILLNGITMTEHPAKSLNEHGSGGTP